MRRIHVYFGLVGCALSAVASPSFAGPSKADMEKALSACPAGQNEGQDGLCQPAQNSEMGYDFVPQGDVAPGGARAPAKPADHTHGKIASVAPVAQTGLLDLQMTFSKASSKLSAADKETADTLTRVLLEPANAGKVVEIVGHTSSSGTEAFNEDLSNKRAGAVKDYLVANGIPEKRLKTIGYGSRYPLGGVDPADPANQRVVLVMRGTRKP